MKIGLKVDSLQKGVGLHFHIYIYHIVIISSPQYYRHFPIKCSLHKVKLLYAVRK